jgi:hypothetical protein
MTAGIRRGKESKSMVREIGKSQARGIEWQTFRKHSRECRRRVEIGKEIVFFKER